MMQRKGGTRKQGATTTPTNGRTERGSEKRPRQRPKEYINYVKRRRDNDDDDDGDNNDI
jgi:hypothetical protein